MNTTFRQLKIFEAVARHLSFTRTSQELHLTQPTVSMQIKQLEQAVGLQLFDHAGKRVYLIDAGREMTRYSRSITAQLQEAGLGLGLISIHTLEMELALNRLVMLDVKIFFI